MNKILSWKINSGTYAYIYVPNSTTYISNRIPEDSPLWSSIIYEISRWDYDIYKANFQKMSKEVNEKYGVNIPWDDLYWNFADENSVGNVNIVLLSGKDGVGGGANVGNGGDGAEVYEELRDAINKELDKAKKDIEEQNKRVQEFVEEKVGETISEAKNTIAETEKELAKTREELEKKLDGAADALDKAAALFDMGEGGITGEKLQEVLSSVDNHNKWMTSYSGSIVDFQTDYDAAKRILGGIGSAEDALAGLFSQIGTTINDMDNTVGNVESWMVASAATIGDIATWYDVNASAVTEASSIINASAGTITDAINFISGDGLTTKVTSIMDGRNATIKDEIMTETSAAVTNVKNEMNGLDGRLTTAITRLDSLSGSLTSMGERWDAVSNSMEEWINVSDSAMSLSHDLRDTWTIESGKLSTVSNLTAETDADGNIIYYVSGETMGEKRVYLRKKDNSENPEWGWFDTDNTEYPKEQVYVNWSQVIGSYIQQQASSVTISVMNTSGLTAAIKAAIQRGENGEEESVIDLISDKVVVTGEMIAKGLRANYAQLGGINLSMGEIWSEATDADGSPMFRLDGRTNAGTLYATNAEIKGKIRATELILDSTNESIDCLVQDMIDEDCVVLDRTFGNTVNPAENDPTVKISRDGLLTAKNAIIDGTIYAKKGEIGGFSLDRNLLSTYDATDSTNPIAILNGSDTYKDDDKGKLILGAGVDTTNKFKTRIYSNGEIYTGMINIESGYFNGEIKSGGYFWGKLSGATGSLNGVTLTNCNINGNIHLDADSNLKMNDATKTYFNVDTYSLSNSSDEIWTMETIDNSWRNNNGDNNGQWYTNTIRLAYISLDKGATVSVPSLSGTIWRDANAGEKRPCKASTVSLKCICVDGGTKKTLVDVSKSLPSIYNNEQTITISGPASSYTMTSYGYLLYEFSYNIHLSTYNGMYVKSEVSIKVNADNVKKKIIVNYPSLPRCTSIAPNGLRVITSNGLKAAFLDGEMEILSPNGKYGLKLSNSGIKIKRNSSSDSDWVDL